MELLHNNLILKLKWHSFTLRGRIRAPQLYHYNTHHQYCVSHTICHQHEHVVTLEPHHHKTREGKDPYGSMINHVDKDIVIGTTVHGQKEIKHKFKPK